MNRTDKKNLQTLTEQIVFLREDFKGYYDPQVKEIIDYGINNNWPNTKIIEFIFKQFPPEQFLKSNQSLNSMSNLRKNMEFEAIRNRLVRMIQEERMRLNKFQGINGPLTQTDAIRQNNFELPQQQKSNTPPYPVRQGADFDTIPDF